VSVNCVTEFYKQFTKNVWAFCTPDEMLANKQDKVYGPSAGASTEVALL
jgi:hypothetical protein